MVDSSRFFSEARARMWLVPKPPSLKGLAWFGLLAFLSLLLCSSVWTFSGHKVDESEIVLNGVAIAAGGWDPTWSPGYGHLAMYLAAGALSVSALFLALSGIAGSYSEGLYLLFADDSAYRIVRLLYAFADVACALVLARVAWRYSGSKLLSGALVVYFLVSPDTWFYADYVRSDTLVSLFVAVALLVLVEHRSRLKPVLLGIALGAAVACKYSAIVYFALIPVLLLPGDIARTGRERYGDVAIATVAAILSTYAFQPLYDYSGIFSAIDTHLAGAHFAREVVPLPDRLARLWGLVLKLEPFALWLALIAVIGACLRPLGTLPVTLAVVVGIAPFALSNYAREYWLIPFADALRLAAWVGAANLLWLAKGRVRSILAWVIAVTVVLVAVVRLPILQKSHEAHRSLTNAEAARRWLYVHVANRKPLVYAYEKNYLLPRAYSFGSYRDAAEFSRIFIFERQGFDSLHDLFRRRLYSREYADFSSMTKVPRLRLSIGGSGELPELCAGSRCFKPEAESCSPGVARTLAGCKAYEWEMDRPALRQDLAKLTFRLPARNDWIATCWYDCGNADAETLAYRPNRGELPLLSVSDRLFAAARILSLKRVAELDTRDHEVYLVTTPQAYAPLLPPALQKKKDPSAAFANRIGARLVRYFDAGRGARIEIYRLQPRRAPDGGAL